MGEVFGLAFTDVGEKANMPPVLRGVTLPAALK